MAQDVYKRQVYEYTTVMAMKRALHLVEELGCGKVSSTQLEVSTGKDVYKRQGYRMDLNIELLAKKAIEAKEHAYVPYSHFRVGAALLTADGKIYTG